MGKINVLSFEVANLIAAGEVVDRPASAIKEMMENAIDAHATHITVEIQNGGSTFMRVTDDGDGMEPDDIPVAIRRHATSKIHEAEDLDGIETLGFRGEALAAISAVSEMRIISKQRNAPYGAMLEVSCGQVIGLTERGCSDGTTIIAEDLFANVPARRKFLKKDVTEAMAVAVNVEKIALSHPEIAVKLIADGAVKLETAGDGQLKSAIWAIFGKDFASKLIEIDGEYDGIKVHGFIGRSDNVRANRNAQNFFINGRFVKSKTATAAIEQAYTAYMPAEKFPVCVTFIEINPKRVDVNVHPAKLEVKFSNEKPVFEAIYYTVRQALEKSVDRPEMNVGNTRGGFTPTADKSFVPVTDRSGESVKKSQATIDFTSNTRIPSVDQSPQVRMSAAEYLKSYNGGGQTSKSVQPQTVKPASANIHESPKPIPQVGERPTEKPPVTPALAPERRAPLPTPPPEVKSDGISYRIVGEVFNSYIIVERGEKMLIIDKHAAHERIIYEKLKANMHAKEVASQLLMLPIEVMLTSSEVGAVDSYRSEIESVGFSFTTARNTVSISAIPAEIDGEDVADMITVIAGRLDNGTGTAEFTRDIIFEKALFQASCKAAIKAGRTYPEGYSEWVVKQLMQIPDITFCPHGRPVAMEMSKRNIDRQFERT